jgi:phosphatidate cytidylyltransferase
MHLKRWITGIVAVPLIFFLVHAGDLRLFALVLGVVSIMTLREYFRIFFKEHQTGTAVLSALAYVTALGLIWAAYLANIGLAMMIMVLNLLLAALISLPLFKTDARLPQLVAKQVLGVIYIPFLLAFLVFLRHGDRGEQWVFLVLCLVAAGDVGAFYVGSYFGRHKLCPAVSPKKTIEGSLGGLSANLVTGICFKLLFLPELPAAGCAIFSLIIGAAGQIGDLFESEFKRAAAVKDSGNLLPGHGGLLDRIDALLFAAPLAYLFRGTIF